MANHSAGDDNVALEHESVDRLANVVVTVVPAVLLGVAIWLAWGGSLHWQDLVVLAITYVITGAGITVGYHRLFTHRSFKTGRPLRALFAVAGSAAVEGPVIEWVSTHRKHHCFSDLPGDPHSPHTDHGVGWRGALRGLLHAHVGWMFRGIDRASEERYAKDLLADPLLRAVDRMFPLWVVLGLVLPFGLGVALTGSLVGGLTGMLWGGAVRILFLHHATFSINSLCHFFGRRPFATGDESRNLAWLALPTFGEAWHNNHHAFPTSAHHGLTRWQVDPGGWLIDGLQRLGLAWDVVRITPGAQAAKLATARPKRRDGSRLGLSCPRCGLTIAPRSQLLAVEHCPRCVARARTLVTLVASPLPANEPCATGAISAGRLPQLNLRASGGREPARGA
jgi:stearoyl-CoA desaturase (delta-9 desaturase)